MRMLRRAGWQVYSGKQWRNRGLGELSALWNEQQAQLAKLHAAGPSAQVRPLPPCSRAPVLPGTHCISTSTGTHSLSHSLSHTHTHTHTHPHTLTHILCSASQLDGSMAVLSQAAMRGLAGTLWRTTRPLLAASPAWAKRAVERGFVELGLLVLNAPSEGIIVIAGGQPKSLSLSLPLFLSLSLPLCFFLSLVSSVAPYLGTYFVVYCIVSPRRRYAMRCYAMRA